MEFLRYLLLVSVLLVLSSGSVNSMPVEPADDASSTLQFVQVAFRHGQRTPTTQYTYPTDPYNGWTYDPVGVGELTNAGKLGEYNIGRLLRQRYSSYLPDVYSPDILEANTSELNRTKNSVQLALAGLFPPVAEEQWNSNIPLWNPIPFYINDIISITSTACPLYTQYLNDQIATAPVQQYLKDNAAVFDYVNQNSGLNATTPWDILAFRDDLYSQQQIGLTIPDWTSQVYPDQLNEITNYAWNLIGSTPDLLRINVGRLVKYILDTFNSVINGELVPPTRKIFLYSAHDITLAWLLHVFDLWFPHSPPYSAFLIFELHLLDDGEYYIRFLYQDYQQDDPKVLSPPGYLTYVPLDAVLQIASPVLDGDLYAC